MNAKRVYGLVAACAVIVYAGALWNRWAFDDFLYIVSSDLVHSADGWWRAFRNPYLPAELGGYLYRPLTIATYAADWHVGGPAWFHFVNLLWHAGAAVLVAVLANRAAGIHGALVAGVVFAVHPVHVEAVANVVGRAELMATAFTLLAVYAALAGQSIAWCTACWVLGLLSKENAAVAPALIITAWALGISRPSARTMLGFCAVWACAAVLYGLARHAVLRPYSETVILAPVFVGETWGHARMTAVAAIADIARLLVFPLKLRADYNPNERTIISSPTDPRLLAGLLCVLVWLLLLGIALRRGKKVEAWALLWVALAYAPVANLLFPTGVLVAERTLYLPSAGLALGIGAAAAQLRPRIVYVMATLVAILGGVRTALRVPVWRSDLTATLSVLDDSPRSYSGPMIMGALYLEQHRDSNALRAERLAAEIFPLESRPYLIGAHAALNLGRLTLADSLLARADRFCNPCRGYYVAQATVARRLGDSTAAHALTEHARRFDR